MPTEPPTWSTWPEAARVVLHPPHLRKTVTIAVVVGTVLFCINQLDVVLRGDATAWRWPGSQSVHVSVQSSPPRAMQRRTIPSPSPLTTSTRSRFVASRPNNVWSATAAQSAAGSALLTISTRSASIVAGVLDRRRRGPPLAERQPADGAASRPSSTAPSPDTTPPATRPAVPSTHAASATAAARLSGTSRVSDGGDSH